ncbi:MAG: PD40 domain-containing protein [Chloroflexi bacterium]|nr:PD40 domain-containing protein [Chloroflexota bacterium]
MHRLIAIAAFIVILVVPVAAQEAPPLDPSNLTASLSARLPMLSAPANTSAHLSPSGTLMLHTAGFDFCVYAMPDTRLNCVDIRDQWDDDTPRPDHETFRWSPDERYVAFTEPAFVFFRDSDIWVFDVVTRLLLNVTNDGYDGSLAVTGDDDAPDSAYVDLAPAWHPDGRLTFVRYNIRMEGAPEVMALTMPDGDPEPIAELPIIPGGRGYVMDMDWAPDGSYLAYAMDLLDSPLSGVWAYFVEDDEAKLLATQTRERIPYLSVSVSPDSTSILGLTGVRDQLMMQAIRPSDTIEDNGYVVISAARATKQPLAPSRLVLSAGWLPDGGLLIVDFRLTLEDVGTDLVALAEPSDEGIILLGSEVIENAGTRFFSPTSVQKKPLIVGTNGVVVLATVGEETLVVQLETGD